MRVLLVVPNEEDYSLYNIIYNIFNGDIFFMGILLTVVLIVLVVALIYGISGGPYYLPASLNRAVSNCLIFLIIVK